MHPGFFGWWARRHAAHHHGPSGEHAFACGPSDCGPYRQRHEGPPSWFAHGGGDDGGSLGVRRPLRFLAHKLELEDPQIERLAAILSALKTERAQAAVEQRRRLASIADVVEGKELDAARLVAIHAEQQKADERLGQAVQKALADLHTLLDEEQRKKLAYLLRTGVLTI